MLNCLYKSNLFHIHTNNTYRYKTIHIDTKQYIQNIKKVQVNVIK